MSDQKPPVPMSAPAVNENALPFMEHKPTPAHHVRPMAVRPPMPMRGDSAGIPLGGMGITVRSTPKLGGEQRPPHWSTYPEPPKGARS
jgi:hypothetical protein